MICIILVVSRWNYQWWLCDAVQTSFRRLALITSDFRYYRIWNFNHLSRNLVNTNSPDFSAISLFKFVLMSVYLCLMGMSESSDVPVVLPSSLAEPSRVLAKLTARSTRRVRVVTRLLSEDFLSVSQNSTYHGSSLSPGLAKES